jgi:hypothetical protein
LLIPAAPLPTTGLLGLHRPNMEGFDHVVVVVIQDDDDVQKCQN